jgi:cytochrome subunit of sulfide dehydrogenase
MLMNNTFAALLGAILLVIAAPVSAAGPTAAMLSNTCAGCHGTDGASVGPASPTISGMSAPYFINTMKAFRDGSRASTVMGRLAKGYTDEEIELMAGWFAEKPFVPARQETDAAAVSKGEKLYADNCDTCHEGNGSLASDDAGILAGQWLPYLNYTMANFRSGARPMDKKMKRKVDELDDAQIDALLQFFASQK